MYDWICNLLEPDVLVQWLIFLGLIWYAWETWKLRKVSQDQNEIMQKPCIVPVVRDRSTDDARDILSVAYDVQAGITPEHNAIDFSGTHRAGLQNIGDGAAFNVRYETQKSKWGRDIGCGRFLYIPRGERVTTHLISEQFAPSDQHEPVKLKVSYESPSGQRYEITMRTQQVKYQDAETETLVTELRETPTRAPSRVKIRRWIWGKP